MFLDDGAASAKNLTESHAQLCCHYCEQKKLNNFTPHQSGNLLGFDLDLQQGMLFISQDRCTELVKEPAAG